MHLLLPTRFVSLFVFSVAILGAAPVIFATEESPIAAKTTPETSPTPVAATDAVTPIAESASPEPTPVEPPPLSEVARRSRDANLPFSKLLPEKPYRATDTFFTMLIKGNIDAAYNIIIKGSPIASKPEDVAKLKEKTHQAVKLFGAVRGYEIVGFDALGTSLVRISCLSLGDRYPLRWHLYFYRVNNGWTMIEIHVDDKLSSLFDADVESKKALPVPQP